jgi:hypothetical protein
MPPLLDRDYVRIVLVVRLYYYGCYDMTIDFYLFSITLRFNYPISSSLEIQSTWKFMFLLLQRERRLLTRLAKIQNIWIWHPFFITFVLIYIRVSMHFLDSVPFLQSL